MNGTCLGKHSEGYKNDTGDYFISFCQNTLNINNLI